MSLLKYLVTTKLNLKSKNDHHELGQDARRYDCTDAGGRATQESKPRTMQEQLSRREGKSLWNHEICSKS